uniref:Uncharacterized protein n=1 Tax=Ixodes ricinus TaxID=34613 RepID=A0A6B0UVV8_IXORI
MRLEAVVAIVGATLLSTTSPPVQKGSPPISDSGNSNRQGRAKGVMECWYTRADRLPKTGSLAQPLSRTPLAVGSIRKCRTSSFDRSPVRFWTLGGGLATLRASPKAPGKELLSRTMKVPGGLLFSTLIASSLLMLGLYQYLEVSFTKTGWW